MKIKLAHNEQFTITSPSGQSLQVRCDQHGDIVTSVNQYDEPDLTDEEKQLVASDFLAAVRSYWKRTGCLLDEAKNMCEAYQSKRGATG